MVCIILFLVLGIVCKLDSRIKSFVRYKLYEEYFDFSSVKEYYDKYLGGVIISDGVKTIKGNAFESNLVTLISITALPSTSSLILALNSAQ